MLRGVKKNKSDMKFHITLKYNIYVPPGVVPVPDEDDDEPLELVVDDLISA